RREPVATHIRRFGNCRLALRSPRRPIRAVPPSALGYSVERISGYMPSHASSALRLARSASVRLTSSSSSRSCYRLEGASLVFASGTRLVALCRYGRPPAPPSLLQQWHIAPWRTCGGLAALLCLPLSCEDQLCGSAQFVHYPLAFGLVGLLDHGARPRGPCLETPALRLPADTPLDVAPAFRLLVELAGQLAGCHVPLKLCLLTFWHGHTVRRGQQPCSPQEPRLSSGAETAGGAVPATDALLTTSTSVQGLDHPRRYL